MILATVQTEHGAVTIGKCMRVDGGEDRPSPAADSSMEYDREHELTYEIQHTRIVPSGFD
jgi:hypothetical protein